MPSLPHLLARLVGQPILCTPDYFEVVLSVLADRIGIEPMVSAETFSTYHRPAKRGYFDKATGIAVMPIIGGLAHRSENVAPASGMAGYTAIQNALGEYADAPSVRGVLLDVDSPGGEVSGLAELGAFIADLAKRKPVYAIANGLMASAAYWMSSGATRIYAAPQATVGSIGVVTAHIDRSKELEKRGQKVTLIHAGKHKVSGNPYEALPDDVRADVQARVDALYGDFVATVAKHRGIDEATVRGTEAGVFSPEKAHDLGLIDGIGTFGEVLRALGSSINRPVYSGYSSLGDNMSERLLYGEQDLAQARAEGVSEGKAAAASAQADAVNKAVADTTAALTASFTDAVASLFAGNPRADLFVEAIKTDGASVALAAKVAARVEAPKAEAAAPVSATRADVDAIVASQTANLSAEGGTVDAREARLAAIRSAGSAIGKSRGYRA